MMTLLHHADDLLRGRGMFGQQQKQARPWWLLPGLVLAFVPLYGAFMGSYALDAPSRLWQVAFSAAKLPLLLAGTTLVCLPAFFVLNTLAGLRDDFGEALQAVFAGQAALAIALAALAPITRFFYFCDITYRAALLLNAGMFAAATLAAHLVMWRQYSRLIDRHRLHRGTLYAWLVLYAFVGIQMGWMLRPFIGNPDQPTTFFRPEPFSNAYIVVFRLVFG